MENSLTYTIFLSTLSLRRATPRICFRCSSVSISIHAPDRPAGLRTIDFYPRSPCGERLGDSGTSRAGETFLSTLSLRRATVSAVYADLADRISIHALLAESDSYCNYVHTTQHGISIHALLAESDSKMPQKTVSFL